MQKILVPLALLAALGACKKEDHTIVAGGAPEDNYNTAADANIVLPPSIKVSKTYRCADGRIARIDWLSDDKSATVTVDKGTPMAVSAPEAGKTMTAADGSSLEGTSAGSSVKLTAGGKSSTCKA